MRSHVWPSANTTSLAGEIVHSARCRPRLSHVVADKVCGRPDERALVAQRRLALLPVWQLQQRVVPGGGVVLRARAQARAGSRLIWRPEISAAVPCSSSHLKSSSQLGCAAADTGDAEAAPFCAARRAGPWSKLPCDSGAHGQPGAAPASAAAGLRPGHQPGRPWPAAGRSVPFQEPALLQCCARQG